jgi:predicted DNA-binding transcriptional regulator AlpA
MQMPTETTAGTDAVEQYLPARQVWERYGVTSMSLWRWLRDPDLRFPRPMRIGRFRYWRLSDLVAWEWSRTVAETAVSKDHFNETRSRVHSICSVMHKISRNETEG